MTKQIFSNKVAARLKIWTILFLVILISLIFFTNGFSKQQIKPLLELILPISIAYGTAAFTFSAKKESGLISDKKNSNASNNSTTEQSNMLSKEKAKIKSLYLIDSHFLVIIILLLIKSAGFLSFENFKTVIAIWQTLTSTALGYVIYSAINKE